MLCRKQTKVKGLQETKKKKKERGLQSPVCSLVGSPLFVQVRKCMRFYVQLGEALFYHLESHTLGAFPNVS